MKMRTYDLRRNEKRCGPLPNRGTVAFVSLPWRTRLGYLTGSIG